jgi:hypothetical protein
VGRSNTITVRKWIHTTPFRTEINSVLDRIELIVRNSLRILAATVMVGAAVCAGVATASAVVTVASSIAATATSSSLTTASASTDVAQQLAWTTGLQPGQSKEANAFRCPSAFPWLEDRRYSDQDVPAGVVVADRTGVDHNVSITSLSTDDSGRITGWPADSVNVGSSVDGGWVVVSAYCTKNPQLAYVVA